MYREEFISHDYHNRPFIEANRDVNMTAAEALRNVQDIFTSFEEAQASIASLQEAIDMLGDLGLKSTQCPAAEQGVSEFVNPYIPLPLGTLDLPVKHSRDGSPVYLVTELRKR
jgi:hypothetical protein